MSLQWTVFNRSASAWSVDDTVDYSANRLISCRFSRVDREQRDRMLEPVPEEPGGGLPQHESLLWRRKVMKEVQNVRVEAGAVN